MSYFLYGFLKQHLHSICNMFLPMLSWLSFRNTAKALKLFIKKVIFLFETGYKNTSQRRHQTIKRKFMNMLDETIIKAGFEYIWIVGCY